MNKLYIKLGKKTKLYIKIEIYELYVEYIINLFDNLLHKILGFLDLKLFDGNLVGLK